MTERTDTADIDDYAEQLARKSRRARVTSRVALSVVSAALLVGVFFALRPWMRTTGRWFRLTRMSMNDRAHPRHGADETPRDRMYGELLPQWAVAVGHAEEDRANAASARGMLDTMEHIAGTLPRVVHVIQQLRALEEHGTLATDAASALPLFDEWNAALLEAHSPYYVYARVHTDEQDRTYLWVSTYRTALDLHPRVGTATVETHIVTRYDHNAGHDPGYAVRLVNGRGTLVFLPELRDFVLARVWPLLAPTAHEPLAAALRAEVGAVLQPGLFAALTRTARMHAEMKAVADAVNARASCGNTYRVYAVPWLGYNAQTMLELANVSSAHGHDVCPAITSAEADTLIDDSLALHDDANIRTALASLVSWFTRIAVVREARTLADVAHPRACSMCDDDDADEDDRHEASADMASIALPHAGAGAFLFACQAVIRHGWSAATFGTTFGAGACGHAPPDNIAGRATTMEAQLFGANESVVMGDELSAALPVDLDAL